MTVMSHTGQQVNLSRRSRTLLAGSLLCLGTLLQPALADEAPAALTLMRALPAARDAAIVGYVREQPQRLVLRTVLGGLVCASAPEFAGGGR